MRTSEASRASGYSAQQVRDLERFGVIPPATREGNEYRSYSARHVTALRAYRGLAAAIGPVEARRMMVGLWSLSLPDAAAVVSAVHVRLAHERDRLLSARAALEALGTEQVMAETAPGPRRHPTVAPDATGGMTVTELARALGVRSSTLRFWEREGLVAPNRLTSLRVRFYDEAAIRRLRVVAALREAGQGIPRIRSTLETLDAATGRLHTVSLIDDRLAALAARTVALLQAGADLADVVRHRV